MPRRRLAAAAAFGAGCAAALWVLWGPMIDHAAHGGSLERCLKNFYAADQYSVLGIARNVQEGASAYVDPYSALGESFYPAEYYRILGWVADATGTSVVWSWNVVGLLVSCLLIALSVAWARRLAPGTAAWVLAPAPFLVGTLYWWQSGGWLRVSGGAVLWPPLASLYSPGAEGPALLLGGAALLALATALTAARPVAWAALAGAVAGLTLQVHANVAVFCVAAGVLILLADGLLRFGGRRLAIAVAAVGAALLVVGALAPASDVGPRLGLVLAAAIAVLVADRRWRRRRGTIALVALGAAIVASLPLSARLAGEILSGGGYVGERAASVRRANVDLAFHDVVLLWLPLWLLVAGVAWWLARGGGRGANAAWLPSLAGVATTTLLLTFAGRFGAYGLEWPRFLIYGAFLTAMIATPALWLMARSAAPTRERAVGIGLAAALVATLPTTAVFVRDQRHAVTCTLPPEATAFAAIGRAAGPGRVVLLDSCFYPGSFRVHSGARVLFESRGIALPENETLVLAALNDIRRGQLPLLANLRAIGVTSFLTNDRCAGVPPETYRAALGQPVARVPLSDPAVFGYPQGLTYELYDLPADATARPG